MRKPVLKIIIIIGVSFLLLILESLIKYVFAPKISQEGLYLIKPVLQLAYVPNYNIAFSLPLPAFLIYFLVISALIFLCFLWWYVLSSGNFKILFAISLVIIGALSNLIDRFALGYVVDYINIFIWPIFNLADCLIVVGILVYIVSELRLSQQTQKGG